MNEKIQQAIDAANNVHNLIQEIEKESKPNAFSASAKSGVKHTVDNLTWYAERLAQEAKSKADDNKTPAPAN